MCVCVCGGVRVSKQVNTRIDTITSGPNVKQSGLSDICTYNQ